MRTCALRSHLPEGDELLRELSRTPYRFARPVDLLVSTKSGVLKNTLRTRHTWCGQLPWDSAVEISNDMCVAAPEFAFLQLSLKLSLEELTFLGFELCGSYAMPTRGYQGTVGIPCLQATTPDRLKRYLSNPALDSAHGIVRARCAASFVTEASNSPRESAMVMLLCMPRRYGGYGIPLPRMNAPVLVPPSLRNVVGREWFSIDAYWQSNGFGIEYDGREGHLGENNVSRDYLRANALEALGITVSAISNSQIVDHSAFNLFANQVKRRLGVRESTSGSAPWREKHRQLRHVVLTTHGWDSRV